jgi:hypothetical protein
MSILPTMLIHAGQTNGGETTTATRIATTTTTTTAVAVTREGAASARWAMTGTGWFLGVGCKTPGGRAVLVMSDDEVRNLIEGKAN